MEQSATLAEAHHPLAVAPPRQPGLDALRAIGALLVVALHAGIPYTTCPIPGLTWPVQNVETTRFADAIVWFTEGFIMPLFFLMSGYCALQSLSGRSLSGFLRQRAKRIGLPLAIACCTILPFELYFSLLAFVGDGRLELRQIFTLKLGTLHQSVWGLSHLWYLQYLLICFVSLASVVQLVRWYSATVAKRTDDGHNAATVRMPPRHVEPGRMGAIVWLAIFTASTLCLALAPQTVIGFQHAVAPVPAKLIYSLIFFAGGAALFALPPATKSRRARSSLRPAIAIGVTAFVAASYVWPAIGNFKLARAAQPAAGSWSHFLFGVDQSPNLSDPVSRLILGAALALFATSMTALAWTLAKRQTAANPVAINYLAGASFWIYLVHHPLMLVLHVALRDVAITAAIKLLISGLGTLALSLVTYEVFVRTGSLGAIINGIGRPMAKPAPERPAVTKAA